MQEPHEVVGSRGWSVAVWLVAGASLFLMGLFIGASFSRPRSASHGVNRELPHERTRIDFGTPDAARGAPSAADESSTTVAATEGVVGAVSGEGVGRRQTDAIDADRDERGEARRPREGRAPAVRTAPGSAVEATDGEGADASREEATSREDAKSGTTARVDFEMGSPTLPAGRLFRRTEYDPWGTVVPGEQKFDPWTQAPPAGAYDAFRPFANEIPPEPPYDPWGTNVVDDPATLTFPFEMQRTVR